MSLDLNKLETKLDEALSNETSETLTKFLNNNRMTNQTNKIDFSGSSNSILLTNESATSTKNICKFEPALTYQNVGSANTLPCAKCGKQAWEHPIITYTEL
jgi:hypothetical protein